MPSREILSVGTGDGVVISGIAGRFPQSDNMGEFARNLYAKRDLVDDKETRFGHAMQAIPRRLGKVNNLEKFDREFFGYNRRQRDTMDPQQWMTLEHVFEAVLDAGVNPESLRGTRTGVFCGVCFSEAGAQMYYNSLGRAEKGMGLHSFTKSLIANRVSYTLDLKGPSFVIDTACSSSMYALDVAYRSMMNGDCDAAIVTGANLTLHPFITYQFALLGVLAKDGYCRPFDKDATGYARAEAICAVFLQKAKHANRIYAYVVHSKTNCDGFKTEGITYPSGSVQQQLLNEFYKEVGISPTEVGYVEAHSTGTIVGDPEECDALDKVYCVGRRGPLSVGSVKSSIGHTEGSAGVCSIAKCIIAMENDLIPPNINFTECRPDIPSLVEGRLKVVTEAIPLSGPLIGINSFGFGGANAHALLCRNLREKKNQGVSDDDLPRLVVWSGRTRESVECMFQDIAQRPLDAEFIALLSNIQKKGILGHRYRGFGIFRKDGRKPAILDESGIQRVPIEPLPIVAIFGGINPKWRKQLSLLMRFSAVARTVAKCDGILQSLQFDLSKKLSGNREILYHMVGSTVLQLSIVEMMDSIGVKFDLYGGHSVGQFTCAYIDRALNLEQVLRLAFWHGLVYADCHTVCDSSAFVQMNSKLKQLPSKAMIMNEAATFGVISGTEKQITEQVQHLTASGFYAETLSFHNLRSENTMLVNKLQQTVHTILPSVISHTKKWITFLPHDSSIFHSSALHEAPSIVNLFQKIPKHTQVIEFGCSIPCKNILRMLNRNSSYLPLGTESTDTICQLLRRIGHIYMSSQNPDIAQLYPSVQFPVSRGTPMISPLILWDHREDASVVKYSWEQTNKCKVTSVNIALNNQDFKYIEGHNIDGRVLFPATGYLKLVWEHVSYLAHSDFEDFSVEFEDIRFLRATTMSKGQSIQFTLSIQDVTGFFEILEGESVVVTGYVRSQRESISNDFKDKPSKAVILPTKDFYKELRLRGYYYSGLFKSVREAKSDGTMAKIQWKDNWVAFLDCLLQVGIISADSRLLMVPTAIEKLSISPRAHMSMIESCKDGYDFFTMRSCVETNTSVCGAVTICNLRASSIGRRNPPGIPVLETYQFVPYHSTAPVSKLEAIRMIVQLVLENVPSLTVNVTEIHNVSLPPIIQMFGEAIADLPLVQTKLTLLSTDEFELQNVTVKQERLSEQSNQLILVMDGSKNNATFVKEADGSLEESGFIIVREKFGIKLDEFGQPNDFNLVASFQVDQEESFICLQRKGKTFNDTPEAIRVDSTDMSWLSNLKHFSKLRSTILFSQNDPISGVLGLVNCIRKEPKMQIIRCVLMDDTKAPKFSLNDPLYKTQLDLGLAINVLRNGVWGSYRHTLLPKLPTNESVSKHCYANCLTKGDLSSMMWFTGAYNEWDVIPSKVNVSYCALNFRDIMVASGRLTSDVSSHNRLESECELGYEYSGVTDDGRRVMGVLSYGALSTVVNADPYLVWDIPDDWSLEEACTIPIVYGTVLMAFTLSTRIRKGQSMLIHAGSGGVGLAAINMALAYGLEVFTTVGTKEKVKFLLSEFPELKKENIGNSRDLSFEQMIKLRTNGRGVDYVLNSLAEEKLQASIRCLAKGGHFLEIGKYDMARDSQLSMELFKRGITFSSVMLDLAMRDSPALKKILNEKVRCAIQAGVVKPLRLSVFDAGDLTKAMRFMASGKHTGKILIKLRENENDAKTLPISYFPKVYCNPDQVYVIVGGLGGFGLELADWLVLRGCKTLVFSSSRGITKPYQQYRIKIWSSYGVQIHICTANITTLDGCRMLLTEATRFGVVAAIYNLAVQLRDSILENQSVEKFAECMAPKAKATECLDILSRQLCPQLKFFVVFSSVSCGRGNAGQSNYGMANSVMERIIERRKSEGLPAKAIQWGAIGEVGLVADMAEDKVDMEIGGTLQQRISSCLQEMDYLLTCDSPIVASMVVAEKRIGSGSKNIIEAVMNIMSIRDLKSVSMESTLADIGMDSLMAVEIKQLLERDFDMVLSPQELRTLSFAKLMKMVEEMAHADKVETDNEGRGFATGMQMLLRNLGNEEMCETTLLRLPSASDEGRPILFIPGVEGVAGDVWKSMAENVKAPVYILQLFGTLECESVPAIVEKIMDEFCSVLLNGSNDFALVAYSFGSLVGIEIVRCLQARGIRGKLLLLDGAPKYLKLWSQKQLHDNPTDAEIQKLVMLASIAMVFPEQSSDKIASIWDVPSFEGQIEKFIELGMEQSPYSADYTRKMTKALCKRIKMAALLNLDEDQPLDLPITLVRPTDAPFTDIEDDYGLSSYTTGLITLRMVEGTHGSMLENPDVVELINDLI